jgi:hypothetical protein
VKGNGLLVGIVLMMTQALWAGSPPSESEPPLDMLEFLGTWQTLDGKAIDPFDLDDGADSSSTNFKSQPSQAGSSSTQTPPDRAGHTPAPRKDLPSERPNR